MATEAKVKVKTCLPEQLEIVGNSWEMSTFRFRCFPPPPPACGQSHVKNKKPSCR